MRINRKIVALVLLGTLCIGVVLFFLTAEDRFMNTPLRLTEKEQQWLDEHAGTIRFATIPDSPPIDFVDSAGRHSGVTADYFRLIEDLLGVTFEQVTCYSWKEIMNKLRRHEIDVVGSIQNTPERRSFLLFTSSYLTVPNAILARKEASRPLHMENLEGMKLAMVDGSATFNFVKELYPDYLVVPVEDAPTGLQMVSFGRADAMITDLAVASYDIEKLGIANLRVAGYIDYSWNLCIASRKDWPELNRIMEKALASIKPEQHKTIARKWISLSRDNAIHRRNYIIATIITLVIAAMAVGTSFFWNRVLKKEVLHRTDELGRMEMSRQQAAQALGESEERFRALVESTGDMVWEVDLSGNYTYVNPRVRDLLGYEPEELIGRSSLWLLTPEDAAKNLQKLREWSGGGSAFDDEINTYIHKSGKKVVLETRGMSFGDAAGNIHGFRGVSRNITDRVRSQQALKKSEERFRNLVEAASDWIWETDNEGRYTYVSPRVSAILGYTSEELIGRRAMDLMPPDEAVKIGEQFANCVEKGLPLESLVNINIHKDGHEVVLETSGVPYYDEDWNVLGYRGIDRDITDRNRIEKLLEFERSLFHSFMDHAPDLIYFKDREGRFIEVNQAKADELHLSKEALIGKTDFDFFPQEQAEEKFQDELAVMQTQKSIHREECTNTPDGVRWYYTTKVPRYDEEGNVTGTFGTSWDITDRKETEEALRESEAKYRDLSDLLPQIVYEADTAGNLTFVNNITFSLSGYTKEDVAKGLGLAQLILPGSTASAKKNHEKILLGRETGGAEYFVKRKDGSLFPVMVFSSPIVHNGHIVGSRGVIADLTEIRQKEDELAEIQALLIAAIEQMPSGVVIADAPDGRIRLVNSAAFEIRGETNKALTDIPVEKYSMNWQVFHPDGAPFDPQELPLAKALRDGDESSNVEIIIQRESGEKRHILVSAAPIRNAQGEIIAGIVIFPDITERVLIEEAIRNIVEGVSSVGREFFKSMVVGLAKSLGADYAFIGEFTSQDKDALRTIAVCVNGEIADNFEYDLEGTPCAEVLQGTPCVYSSGVYQAFPEDKLLLDMKVEAYVGIPLIDSENNSRGIMVALYKRPLDETGFASSILQVFAGRTTAELERLQAGKEMARLRHLLSNIINSMPSILVGVDTEGHVMQWNREAENATGITPEQAQGQNLASVFPDLADEMEKVRDAINNRSLARDEKIPRLVEGETRYSDVTVYPLVTDGVEGAVIRVDDITERVRIEDMMVQTEKMLSVGGLAAGMAHEINNPLAGIMQNIQVMRNRVVNASAKNTKVAEECGTSLEAVQAYFKQRGLINMIDAIMESGRRAAKIVDNMLGFSRKSELHVGPCDLKDLLEKCIELASNDYDLKRKYDFRHIKIVRDYDPALQSVSCESNQIQQVIINLLRNSAHALSDREESKEPPCITLRLKKEKRMVLLEVEDNGPGMNDATRKRIFEPFFTTKEVGTGTGLGLSVSYFIVTETHSGTMGVESAPGQGAKFSIRLPLKPPAQPNGRS